MSEKKQLLNGYTEEQVAQEELEVIKEAGILVDPYSVRLQPDGWLHFGDMLKYLDKIYSFKFRSDDVIVMTFPKSGTTWMQEILWTMVHNPDLTHPKTNTPILDRSPNMAFDFVFDSIVFKSIDFKSYRKWFAEVCPGRKEEDGILLQICELIQGRRILKCHLPFPLLPPDTLETAKIVYVARNPKDVCVSYYSMLANFNVPGSSPSLEKLTRVFMNNQVTYGPYWRHVELGWEKRNHPNMEFIFYEELKADTMKHLQRLNDFIGTNLTQSQLEAVANHTSFKSMKGRGEPLTDPITTNFFRKGTAGDWKGQFSPKLLEELDAWIEENASRIGITFKWD